MRFVTQELIDNDIASAIEAREAEIANYQLNEMNFAAILGSYNHLSLEWPQEIAAFKGKDSATAAAKLSDEAFDLYTQYSHRDQIATLLKTTKAERFKSEKILEALEASITEDRIKAAVTRIKNKTGGGL